MDYFLNPTNLVQNNIQNKLISRLRVSITIIILFNFIELLYAEFPQIKNLDNMLNQIREDHENAKRLAKGIDQIEGLSIDLENIKTNILYFDIDKGTSRCDELSQQTQNIDIFPFEIELDNIRFFESQPSRFRLVTHYGITDDDIEKTLLVLRDILK